MKKIIILRGHPGAGKSTYAKKLINEHTEKYPNISTLHIEYDMIREELHNGEYIWREEDTSKVRAIFKERFEKFIDDNKSGKKNALVIISNVSPKVSSFKDYLDYAKSRGFEEDVRVLEGLFPNAHNVPLAMCVEMFETIKKNPYPGEVEISTGAPVSSVMEPTTGCSYCQLLNVLKYRDFYPDKPAEVKIFLALYANFLRITKSKKYPELSTIKYNQKVSFDNFWNRGLRRCRGLIVDDEYNVIAYPFDHNFNFHEVINRDSKYHVNFMEYSTLTLVPKFNGFLGVATYVSGYPGKSFDKKVIYSTTGTIDSDFAVMVEEHLSKYETMFKLYSNHSFMFEILDERDPHIVKEEPGEVFIGLRNYVDPKSEEARDDYYFIVNRSMATELTLDHMAMVFNREYNMNIKRPRCLYVSPDEMISRVIHSKYEGFMVRDASSGRTLCKYKTPYYQVIKYFGRVGDEPKKAEKMLLERINNYKTKSGPMSKLPNIMRSYFDKLVEHIENNMDIVVNLKNIHRIKYLRKWIDDNLDISYKSFDEMAMPYRVSDGEFMKLLEEMKGK